MSKNSYIQGIDGLRAFAVLSVMLFHLKSEFLPGGFTGVDVFFVISGYVVTGSLYNNYNSNFFKFTLDFYKRRILRIIPVLIIFLVITSIVTTLIIPQSWLSETTSKTGLYAFFGFSNYGLLWFNDGYFSPRIEFNPFVHTWSLSVEEQFYFIFPLIFFLWFSFKENSNIFVQFLSKNLLLIILIISFSFSVYQSYQSPTEAFYLLPSRFWELGLGALLFKLHSENKLYINSITFNRVALYVGTLLIFTGFVVSDENMFPFPFALLPVIGTLLLIIGFSSNKNYDVYFRFIFENKLVVFIGKISYSLYLWHWAVYVLFRWTVGLESYTNMFIAVLLTFFLSVISYYFIENAFRYNNFVKLQASYKVVLSGLLVIFFGYYTAKYVFKNQSNFSLSVTKDRITWYPEYHPILTNYDSLKKYTNKKIFVLGDSHTGAYSTMLHEVSKKFGIELLQYSSGGCGIADFRSLNLSQNSSCKDFVTKVLDDIQKKASPGDILFLASLRLNRFADQFASFPENYVLYSQNGEEAIQNRKIILDETKELLKKFSNMKVIIDLPKPIFKAPPFRCSDWFNKNNPICLEGFEIDRKFIEEYRLDVVKSINSLAKDFDNIYVWDPLEILCEEQICRAYSENGKPLFFDADHLSGYGNMKLLPYFSNFLENILENSNDK